MAHNNGTSTSIYNLIDSDKANKEGRKMIEKYRKKTKNIKLKSYRVPKDPCNTVFFCENDDIGQRKINEYTREHKAFWI